MPKAHIEGLISQLHERLTDSDTSPQQDALMAKMQSQLAGWEGDAPADGDIRKTAELLADELEENHPKLAMFVKDLVQAMHNAGL